MKIIIFNINLIFIRYILFEENNKLNEKMYFKNPLSTLKEKIGEHIVFRRG